MPRGPTVGSVGRSSSHGWRRWTSLARPARAASSIAAVVSCSRLRSGAGPVAELIRGLADEVPASSGSR
ncbi:hypothetical protein [Nocardiopsis alba]|uniref:hypothetical protein n=1 Tax=Nocardiopsis alba TaxID=53437 RepID=UPI0036270883